MGVSIKWAAVDHGAAESLISSKTCMFFVLQPPFEQLRCHIQASMLGGATRTVSRSVFLSSAIPSVSGVGSSFRVLPASSRASNSQKALSVRASIAKEGFSSSAAASMSLTHIPQSKLHVSTPTWWLESRFHFSFAEYYNPSNLNFGVLRVLNDDLVKPKSGFGKHPHRDAEIFTYVVDGSLTHKDSMGTAETLGRGAVQYMSAGNGVTHSEMNNGDQLLRFLQIWIKPNKTGLTPNYGSRTFNKSDRHNKLQHVLTSYDRYEQKEDTHEGVIPIHQDVEGYVSEADPGVEQEFVLGKRRQVYLVCIEGSLTVNDTKLDARDALEIRAKTSEVLPLKLVADSEKGAHFLFLEMALSS